MNQHSKENIKEGSQLSLGPQNQIIEQKDFTIEKCIEENHPIIQEKNGPNQNSIEQAQFKPISQTNSKNTKLCEQFYATNNQNEDFLEQSNLLLNKKLMQNPKYQLNSYSQTFRNKTFEYQFIWIQMNIRRVSMYIWTIVTLMITMSNILIDMIMKKDNFMKTQIQSMFVDQSKVIHYGLLVRSKSIIILQALLLLFMPILIYLIHFKKYKIRIDGEFKHNEKTDFRVQIKGMWMTAKQNFLNFDKQDQECNQKLYYRLREAPFFKDRYLINMIYIFYNLYTVSFVLVYALCFYDTAHLIWQIQYGLDNINLNQNEWNSQLKLYIMQVIQSLNPCGIGFGFAFVSTLTFVLFYSLEIYSTTNYIIFLQIFMFSTIGDEYEIGYFIQISTFIGAFTMIGTNYIVQKTLRTYFVFNIKIENQYKEQSDIFENLTDGAIIYKIEEKEEINQKKVAPSSNQEKYNKHNISLVHINKTFNELFKNIFEQLQKEEKKQIGQPSQNDDQVEKNIKVFQNSKQKEDFNDISKIQSNHLSKFYLMQLKKKESYISQIQNQKQHENIHPKSIIEQINLLENGEVFQVQYLDSQDTLRPVSKIVEPRTFADKVKDFIEGKSKTQYKIFDQNKKKHKKFLIQIQNKTVKFNDEQCTVTFFKDVTNSVYEGQISIQNDYLKLLVNKLIKNVQSPFERIHQLTFQSEYSEVCKNDIEETIQDENSKMKKFYEAFTEQSFYIQHNLYNIIDAQKLIVQSCLNLNEQQSFEFQSSMKHIYEYFKKITDSKKINFEFQMYFEEFDYDDLKFRIIKNKFQMIKNNMNYQENSSMGNINTCFPTYMQGDKRKFLKTIEILITNAINESEKYGYIKVQMNFNHNKNLIYFCIQNTSNLNRSEDNKEINKMMRQSNYNISIEFLNCLKNNDSILGLYNANKYIKLNNGSMKYKHENNKGTKVMFTFMLKICDNIEKSPSIFTERSLLNGIIKSPKLQEQSQMFKNASSNFGLDNNTMGQFQNQIFKSDHQKSYNSQIALNSQLLLNENTHPKYQENPYQVLFQKLKMKNEQQYKTQVINDQSIRKNQLLMKNESLETVQQDDFVIDINNII